MKSIYEEADSNPIPYVIGGLLAIMFIAGFFMSVFWVNPGEKGMIYSWSGGLQDAVYDEGMHLKAPLVNTAIFMNTRVQKQEEEATAASKDLQDVTTKVAVNFKIDTKYIKEIYRTIGPASTDTDYMQSSILNPIIQESVKQATAQYTAEELISKRPEVKKVIDDRITTRLSEYHIIVTDVSITDFKFSPAFSKAIEEKVTAEQNALREEKNVVVAKNIAQQKIETAKGQAEAIQIVNKQLSNSPEYVQFMIVDKWNGVMPLALGSNSITSIATVQAK